MIGTLIASGFGAAVLCGGQLWVLDRVFKTSTAAIADNADRSVWERWCTAMMLQEIGASAITALIVSLLAALYVEQAFAAACGFVVATTAAWMWCTYRLRPHQDSLLLWNGTNGKHMLVSLLIGIAVGLVLAACFGGTLILFAALCALLVAYLVSFVSGM